jgi:hypothetical protein
MSDQQSMTSGGRTKRILELAQENSTFRKKVVTLGTLGDQMTYPTMAVFQQFAPLMLEVASEAGLMDGIDQAAMDELNEWFSDSANELAYLVQSRQRTPPSRRYRKPIGHVFVSWTVKNPRDREATRGFKAALDWFNIDYFDYTEHQLDDERDMTVQIEQQLKDAIAKLGGLAARAGWEILAWVLMDKPLPPGVQDAGGEPGGRDEVVAKHADEALQRAAPAVGPFVRGPLQERAGGRQRACGGVGGLRAPQPVPGRDGDGQGGAR